MSLPFVVCPLASRQRSGQRSCSLCKKPSEWKERTWFCTLLLFLSLQNELNMSAELWSASVFLSYLTLGALDVGRSLCHLALQLHQYGCWASEALLRSLLQRVPLPLRALRWDVRLPETNSKNVFQSRLFYAFNRASIVERRWKMVTPRPPGTLITLFINNLKSCLFTNVPFGGFQYALYSFFLHEPHHFI